MVIGSKLCLRDRYKNKDPGIDSWVFKDLRYINSYYAVSNIITILEMESIYRALSKSNCII